MTVEQDTLYKIVGARLKFRRAQMNLTQNELAMQLGISRASVANIEAGQQNTTVFALYEFCSVLNLSPSQLFPGLDEVRSAQSKKFNDIAKEMKREGNTKAAEILNSICKRHLLEEDEF